MVSWSAKQERLKKDFSFCNDVEAIYKKIIQYGHTLIPLDKQYRTDDYKVTGCQSIVYLKSQFDKETNTVQFQVHSDALITKGLVAILTYLYSGESPKDILTSTPTILAELGIPSLLSPNRALGLKNLIRAFQQAAIPYC